MVTGRRYFLSSFAAIFAGARALWAAGQRREPSTGIPRSSDASGSLGSSDDPPAFPRPDPREQLKESQKNLRRNADRLLQLAKELKEEADKTEQTDVLSLSLIHRAEEIEKIARQIKGLVRAA